MEYVGNLYAKLGEKYIKIATSQEFDILEAKAKKLEAAEKVIFELTEKNKELISEKIKELQYVKKTFLNFMEMAMAMVFTIKT